MPLFGRSREPNPEDMAPAYLRSAPPMSRADNLAIACAQQVATLDVAGPSQLGTLLTVSSLEPASQVVREAMSQDRDLSAWIARKSGVMLHAAITGGMNGGVSENIDTAFAAAGLQIESEVTVREPATAGDSVQRDGAAGLGAACLALLQIVSATPDRWSSHDRSFYVNLYTAEDGADVEGLAYDLVAWQSVVLGRLGHRRLINPQMPIFNAAFGRVPRLERAGWYPNPPKFGDTSSGDAQIQRYWDGQWTPRVRVRQGSGWNEITHSLHDTPQD